MKQKINNEISRATLVILLAAFVYVFSGCTTSPHPDPLAGWQGDFNEQPNQVIINDYQNYIQQLPQQERQAATIDDWLKDGKGQHAIMITVSLDGTTWRHILIYDKDNKKIKVIKYSSGGYRS
jgi:hypothetical protein